jgi:Lon protease-like protein
VLGDCYHFPGCDLPLRIFEERYRKMLEDALETDRVFGVGVRVNEQGLFPFATAGLIRSSVRSGNGTSQVVLHGLERVQITGIRQLEPYVIAEVSPVRTVEADPADVGVWRKQVVEVLGQLAQGASGVLDPLLQLAREETQADRLCDLLGFQLVTRPRLLQQLLAEANTQKRMDLILEGLRCGT